MTLIVCVDDNYGLLFNNRRQSRDVRVCDRILEIAAGKTLRMNGYSARMFPQGACVVSEDIFSQVEGNDLIFAECEITPDILNRTDRLVVYRWNRSYPSDIKFPVQALINQFKKVESADFPGKSHDLITEEVYVR